MLYPSCHTLYTALLVYEDLNSNTCDVCFQSDNYVDLHTIISVFLKSDFKIISYSVDIAHCEVKSDDKCS